MNRRETSCLFEDTGPMTNRMSHRGPDGQGGVAAGTVEEILRSKTSRERWMILMKLIREQFPHGIMYSVNIVDGIMVSCRMQQCLMFGPPETRDGVDPTFDANWQELEALCNRIGTGQLAEVHFTDGQPIRAKTTPRGRRFRYFIKD